MNGRSPTAAEKKHIQRVADLGCIVCLLFYNKRTPAEIHHTDGAKKPGAHFKILGLCYRHHRSGEDSSVMTSRHPWKKRFEKRYLTEEELMKKQNNLIYGDNQWEC